MNGTIQRMKTMHFRELVEKRQRFCHHPVDYAGGCYRLYFADRLRARLAGHAPKIEHQRHTVFQW